MIFCGQCGLQLPAGTTRCSRCGAIVEETNVQASEIHSDDATIASLSTHNPTGLAQASPPQPLILRPGANSNDYGSQLAYDATSRMDAPNYGTQVPQNPNMGPAYGGNYPQQSGSAYPAPGNYSDFANRVSGTYAGGGYPMNTQRVYQQPYTSGTNKVRVTGLVIVVLGVLFLVIAVILFFLQQTKAIAGATSSPSAIISTTSTPTLSHTQLGQQTIQQYYDYINKQNYQDAYNLWKNPQESFAQFRSGFQHTKHDDVRFGDVTEQADGTVKVTVTVTATEETQQHGTQQSIYAGYYITSNQDDNTWKITRSQFQKQ